MNNGINVNKIKTRLCFTMMISIGETYLTTSLHTLQMNEINITNLTQDNLNENKVEALSLYTSGSFPEIKEAKLLIGEVH